ncbi:alpha/beta-hydrolase [Penicillium malachiteum]|uniref:Alpha/beta-hydrolase n=1 Tax=Penicillium malachiteum TaxID=1324776 RepID=A0AAD6HBE3_9EURO|nr:alpha/beta-hydrolase [Penicillium malachiteum]
MIHTLRVPPSQITLSGDSSGGHLVLALLRYITQFNNAKLLPAPQCSWVWSPWYDVLAALDPAGWVRSSNYKTECIHASFPTWGVKLFIGDLEIIPSVEEYLTPLNDPFSLPSTVLFVVGGREVLVQDVQDLANIFAMLPGNEASVEFYKEELVPHDVLMIG